MTDPLILTQAEFERLKPLLWHSVEADVGAQMARLRAEVLTLALKVLREQPPSRSQSLALTHLEDTLMRGIQGLALQGTPSLPPGVTVEVPDGPER